MFKNTKNTLVAVIFSLAAYHHDVNGAVADVWRGENGLGWGGVAGKRLRADPGCKCTTSHHPLDQEPNSLWASEESSEDHRGMSPAEKMAYFGGWASVYAGIAAVAVSGGSFARIGHGYG